MILWKLFSLWIIAAALIIKQAHSATINVPPGSTLSTVLAGSANGDILQLQAGTYYVTAEVDLSDGGSRTIVGAGRQSTVISPASSSSLTRFLDISAGSSVVLQDLKLQGFTRDPAQTNNIQLAGAVILLEGGSVTLDNCQCSQNTANAQNGGVVATSGASAKQLTVTSCIFDTNQASDGSAISIDGDGDSCTVDVTDTTFTSHINTLHGVIDIGAHTDATVTITACTFANNVAGDRGSLSSESSVIVVKDSTFMGNVADSGGAIGTAVDTQLSVYNCTFDGNQARSGAGAVRAIAAQPVLFKQCTFINNQALNQAGAIELDQPSFTVDECYFANNAAPIGGAVNGPESVNGDDVYANVIKNSVFVDNIGSTAGGAMWLAGSVNVLNCSFINNTGGQGGAIFHPTHIFRAQDSVFSGNSARNGGAIYITSDASLQLAGIVEIVNNEASTEGGGLVLASTSLIEVGASVHVADNKAVLGGGISLFDATSFEIEGTLLVERNTASYGGGLYLDDASYLACSINSTEQRLTVADNVATLGGGGVFFASNELAPACPSLNATFQDNTAPYGAVEGSLPSSISWRSVVPKQIRVGEHFNQNGQLLDIFDKAIRAASTLLSFEMSIVANNKSKPLELTRVSLVGLTTTAPRDLDGALRFRPFVTSTSAAQLPMSFSLAIISRPLSLPPQYFDITLTTCEGGYTSYVVDGELFCLELITASSWARAIAGAAAGVGLVVVGFMWLMLLIKPDKMVHFGRTASVACLHAVCLGSFVILISIFPWMDDNDSNCVARPWLAVIGLTFLLSGLFAISFADVLRSQRYKANDVVILVVVLVLSLIANVVVLIVWTAEDPYQLMQEVGLASNTLKEYCYSSDTVYIWILVGFYAGLGALYLLSLFLQRNVSFRFRQSKHFSLYSIQAAAISAAMIPVAAVYFTDLDVFFLVTTLGLVGVALLPVIPLVGLRVYRAFYPMEGERRRLHVEFLIKDHRHRQSQVSRMSMGGSQYSGTSPTGSPSSAVAPETVTSAHQSQFSQV